LVTIFCNDPRDIGSNPGSLINLAKNTKNDSKPGSKILDSRLFAI